MTSIEKKSGVYEILCTANGKRYVGSAVRFDRRWNLHRVQLRQNNHHSPHLQNAWNKYGKDAFEFRILHVCAPEDVLTYEQAFLDEMTPEFNTCKIAGSNAGIKMSEQTKKRLGAAQRRIRKKYDWKGQKLCLSDIAEMENVDRTALLSRVLGCGMTIEDAVSRPKRVFKHTLTHDGVTDDIAGWATRLNIHPRRLHTRLSKGLTISECIDYFRIVEKRMSFSGLCELLGANVTTAKSRLKSGMSLMEAVTLPAGPTSRRKEAA